MKTGLSRRSLLPAWSRDLFDSNNFFDDDLDGLSLLKAKNGLPTVNITENDGEYVIDMAAPGLERKDFKVEVENGTLCISSEKKEEKEEKKKNYLRREYSHSSFSRSFTLPDNCDPDKIDAKYDNGILKVTINKREKTVAKPAKTIKVG